MPTGNKVPVLGYASIQAMCDAENINRSTWKTVQRKRPDLSDEERLHLCKSYKDRRSMLGYKNAKELCFYEGINYAKWRQYAAQFKDIPPQERLEAMKNGTAPKCWEGYTGRRGEYKADINSDDAVGERPIKPGFYVIRMPPVDSRDTNY